MRSKDLFFSYLQNTLYIYIICFIDLFYSFMAKLREEYFNKIHLNNNTKDEDQIRQN